LAKVGNFLAPFEQEIPLDSCPSSYGLIMHLKNILLCSKMRGALNSLVHLGMLLFARAIQIGGQFPHFFLRSQILYMDIL